MVIYYAKTSCDKKNPKATNVYISFKIGQVPIQHGWVWKGIELVIAYVKLIRTLDLTHLNGNSLCWYVHLHMLDLNVDKRCA